ncbi:MAG TPA: (2Fe-2S)-binding protein [Polyangiaceae bacterium]|nr:(2Fe-2S)-binding protein [Polyangiaceae bacterium]
MLICHCNLVTDREIREAIRAGAHTVCAVSEACDAGSCCGGCRPMIEKLIRLERRALSQPPASTYAREALMDEAGKSEG